MGPEGGIGITLVSDLNKSAAADYGVLLDDLMGFGSVSARCGVCHRQGRRSAIQRADSDTEGSPELRRDQGDAGQAAVKNETSISSGSREIGCRFVGLTQWVSWNSRRAWSIVLRVFFTGSLIGIANIIPGVSGRNMALALGIYERLIAAVGQFGPGTVGATLGALRFSKESRQRFAAEWRRIDGAFLSWIAVGGAVAVVVFSRVMVWLLKGYHDPTYGFFTGLILVSIVIPFKMICRFGGVEILSALVALGLVLALTFSVDPDEQLADAKRKVEMKRAKAEQVANFAASQKEPALGQAGVGRLAFSCCAERSRFRPWFCPG